MTNQINTNKSNLNVQMDMLVSTSNTVNFLKSLKSFYKFEETTLPPEISMQDIVSALRFLSPQIILIHGSYATKVRYSTNAHRDFDMIIVSIKIPFWLKEDLYKDIRDRLSRLTKSIKFDISLVTLRGLLAHIHEKTSLGQSILQGFTIMYEGNTYGY